jgi:hypothetical protein
MGSGLPETRSYVCCVADLYEQSRTHLSLKKDTPIARPIQPMGTGTIIGHSSGRRLASSLPTNRSLSGPATFSRNYEALPSPGSWRGRLLTMRRSGPDRIESQRSAWACDTGLTD